MSEHEPTSRDVRALEALLGAPWIPEDYVRFRVEVRLAQGAIEARLAAEAAPSAGAAPALPLATSDVPWDEWMLADLMDELVAITARRAPESADLARVREALGGRPGRYTQFASQAVYAPENDEFRRLAREQEIPLYGLLLLGRMLASPFFREARRRLAVPPAVEPDALAEASGRCSVCAQPATQARLRREDGRQLLGCALCGHEWLFSRVTCAACGTKEQSHLKVVYLDDDDVRWIATCDKCRRYLKCVDERKLSGTAPFSFFAEETASLSLDLLAEREGYVRPF